MGVPCGARTGGCLNLEDRPALWGQISALIQVQSNQGQCVQATGLVCCQKEVDPGAMGASQTNYALAPEQVVFVGAAK